MTLYLYLRISFNILKLATFINILWLLPCWLIFGIFFLIYTVFKDTYYYIKTLCDYKDGNDIVEKKEEEDQKQDLVVIYNEIFEVMRSILIVFKQHNMTFKERKAKIKKK